jgi:periplasmic divalent cation tolerance protein
MEILMFYVTFPNEKEALYVSRMLLEDKLIACYNLFPMNSGFWWEGTIDNAIELVAVYKTDKSLEKRIEQLILQNHSYEVPCIIRSTVKVNTSYGQWIQEAVGESGD